MEHLRLKIDIFSSVLDLVSQVRDVVLVMCMLSSGKPQGVGILERGVYGEGDGNGEISLRATWDQGGQILSQQGGFQVSRGNERGPKRNEKEKNKKQGDCTTIHCIPYSCT